MRSALKASAALTSMESRTARKKGTMPAAAQSRSQLDVRWPVFSSTKGRTAGLERQEVHEVRQTRAKEPDSLFAADARLVDFVLSSKSRILGTMASMLCINPISDIEMQSSAMIFSTSRAISGPGRTSSQRSHPSRTGSESSVSTPQRAPDYHGRTYFDHVRAPAGISPPATTLPWPSRSRTKVRWAGAGGRKVLRSTRVIIKQAKAWRTRTAPRN